MTTLTGQVAIVTGASAGIGKACAELFAAEGIAVALAARRADRLEQVAAGIEANGGRAIPLVADVTSEDDMQRVVAAALTAFGRVDIMVCNAGFGYRGTIEQTDPAVMRRLIDVNFMGTYYAARAVVPEFRRAGRGHLIMMSSIVGKRAIAYMGAYSATKFAQVGLAESLRAEFLNAGIHVSVVYPVSTESEFLDSMARDYGLVGKGLGPRQSAEHVARSIVACLEHPRAEVYPYRLARWVALLNAAAPGICDRIVVKYGASRKR